jgi:hypothetical protein
MARGSIVEVETHQATAMLDRISRNAEHVTPALERVGRAGAATVTGIPVDTGRLAASPRARTEGDEVLIVSDVPYARYVFNGTKYVPARPPNVHPEALAKLAGREVSVEVFK